MTVHHDTFKLLSDKHKPVFHDVTDQLPGPLEPPRLKVAIFWDNDWSYDLMLSDIVYEDLGVDNSTVTYRTWPDIMGLLPPVVDDWPWNLKKWDKDRY